uniref:Retrotransposon protein, putative, unclassified n=2 Tax=Oryza sativa subsp. japonica TaxID=39947 RepID=Q53K97_ORYSJ|nr:retrotransposon protein, putative, unclassified [Oryza sativa Japonica Group]ABA93147.1 retrotransposon protein, putative, unclassified [Oryza sativa Japonica Group]
MPFSLRWSRPSPTRSAPATPRPRVSSSTPPPSAPSPTPRPPCETAARDAIATLLRPHLQAPASGELIDTASTLVDPTAAPATAAPATAVPPTPIALSAADLAAVAAQLGALSTSPRQVLPPSSSTPPAPPLVLDAETLATLHQQAIAVLNIKALIPVTLDLATANYTRWRGMFLVVLGKYALTDHVLSDDPPSHPDWAQMDCVVLTWLYGTISSDLFQEVLSPTSTAPIVWRNLEHQFLGNSELRAINLTAEFYTFVQGDMSGADYCRRLRAMADSLADLGEPITDKTLVLNFLRGLNEKYHNLQTILPMQRPFPTFLEA